MNYFVQDTKGKWSPPIGEQQVKDYIRDGFIKAHTVIADATGRSCPASKHPEFARAFTARIINTGQTDSSLAQVAPQKACPGCGKPSDLSAEKCVPCGHVFRTKFPSVVSLSRSSSSASVPVGQTPPAVHVKRQTPMCSRCGRQAGILGLNFSANKGRCLACEKEYKHALDKFRTRFISLTSDTLTDPILNEMRTLALNDRIQFKDALSYVREEAISIVNRAISIAAYDGMMTPVDEQKIEHIIAGLAIPNTDLIAERRFMDQLKTSYRIRSGHLPTVTNHIYSVFLESDEICHLVSKATFWKVTSRGVVPRPGTLLATNKKLRFLSPEHGGVEIAWRNVMRVSRSARMIQLELTTQKGNGEYTVPDPILAEAVIETITRSHKRNVVFSESGESSRHVPHDVRVEVWRRDKGCCVQCKASSYLEFDHIIPHSKGGANSTANIQLLCRKCNLAKSDRL